MAFLNVASGAAGARRDIYERQDGAQRSQFHQRRADTRSAIAQSVGASASRAGNPNLAGRLAAQATGRAMGDINRAEGAAQLALGAQQAQAELAAREAEEARTRSLIGGLVGGAGQVLGMAVPAFGALNGAGGALTGGGSLTGALGNAAGGGSSGSAGLGGLLGGALGGGAGIGGLAQAVMGGGAPQQPPQAAPAPLGGAMLGTQPAAPTAAPQTLGMPAQAFALPFAAPTGQPETFEERMRRLQMGGGFVAPPIGGMR